MSGIDERKEKIAIKTHTSGDEMPHGDAKKAGASDEQIWRRQCASENASDEARDMDGVPTALIADLQCNHKPANVVWDVCCSGDKKSGCGEGTTLTKGDVVKKEKDGDVVMDNPDGSLRRGGRMHDVSGGVVEIEGENEEKGRVGKRGITVERIFSDWRRVKKEMEVE